MRRRIGRNAEQTSNLKSAHHPLSTNARPLEIAFFPVDRAPIYYTSGSLIFPGSIAGNLCPLNRRGSIFAERHSAGQRIRISLVVNADTTRQYKTLFFKIDLSLKLQEPFARILPVFLSWTCMKASAFSTIAEEEIRGESC